MASTPTRLRALDSHQPRPSFPPSPLQAYDTAANFVQYSEIIKPFGKIVSIVETNEDLPLTKVCTSGEVNI